MTCLHSEIASYLDGELSSNAEIFFERHLATCDVCANRLNEQKQVLLALDAAFSDEKRLELPIDFTKKVIVHAESSVFGLREKSERKRAIFLVSGLLLTVAAIAILSRQSQLLFAVSDVIITCGRFFANFIYSFGFSVVVILRVVNRHFFFDSPFSVLFAVALFVFSLLALSHFLNRYHRIRS